MWIYSRILLKQHGPQKRPVRRSPDWNGQRSRINGHPPQIAEETAYLGHILHGAKYILLQLKMEDKM